MQWPNTFPVTIYIIHSSYWSQLLTYIQKCVNLSNMFILNNWVDIMIWAIAIKCRCYDTLMLWYDDSGEKKREKRSNDEKKIISREATNVKSSRLQRVSQLGCHGPTLWASWSHSYSGLYRTMHGTNNTWYVSAPHVSDLAFESWPYKIICHWFCSSQSTLQPYSYKFARSLCVFVRVTSSPVCQHFKGTLSLNQ